MANGSMTVLPQTKSGPIATASAMPVKGSVQRPRFRRQKNLDLSRTTRTDQQTPVLRACRIIGRGGKMSERERPGPPLRLPDRRDHVAGRAGLAMVRRCHSKMKGDYLMVVRLPGRGIFLPRTGTAPTTADPK